MEAVEKIKISYSCLNSYFDRSAHSVIAIPISLYLGSSSARAELIMYSTQNG
jgi:hypothetical protein